MSDDIVTRLRGNEISRANQLEAAEAIEWYRSALQSTDDLTGRLRELERDLIRHRPKLANDYYLTVIGQGADEIERLREVISRMVPR